MACTPLPFLWTRPMSQPIIRETRHGCFLNLSSRAAAITLSSLVTIQQHKLLVRSTLRYCVRLLGIFIHKLKDVKVKSPQRKVSSHFLSIIFEHWWVKTVHLKSTFKVYYFSSIFMNRIYCARSKMSV